MKEEIQNKIISEFYLQNKEKRELKEKLLNKQMDKLWYSLKAKGMFKSFNTIDEFREAKGYKKKLNSNQGYEKDIYL